MRRLRESLRDLLPGPLRERYHRYALERDFGIDRRTRARRPTAIDPGLPPGVNLVGYFASSSGVGQSARSLADAAERAGIPVAQLEASSPPRRRRIEAPHDVNLYHVNADAADAVVEAWGPSLHAGRANVAYWYWESESFPDRWKDRFDYFDEVWVATEFCRRSIAAVSRIPVELVPPAVTLAAPAPDAKAAAGFDSSDFVFLTILDALSVPERKNPLAAARAFARAFSRDSPALLHVQVSNAGRTPGLLAALEDASGAARLRIVEGLLPRPKLERLLAACDAYVSLHRAEGFGFPIAEAMSLGKPAVATGYSGNADYLDESTGFPVRWTYTTLPEKIRDYDRGTRWAEPDEAHAAELLRLVLERPEEARRRGEAARRRVAELYSPSVAGRRIAARLQELRRRLKDSS